MFRGLSTVTFSATDVAAAARWYAELFGVEPYFVRPLEGPPAYAEFRIGDDEDELGLIDRSYLPPTEAAAGPGGAIVHWHVDDLAATLADLLERGAVVHQPLTVREAGFATVAVVDPFGNVLGLMTSPHWLARHQGGS